MNDEKTKILLVEDNSRDIALFRLMIEKIDGDTFTLKIARNLQSSLEILTKESIDIIILNLMLSDSRGLSTFTKLHQTRPNVPIMIICHFDDERSAQKAVHQGALDYLIKGEINANLLKKAINYSIEKNKILTEKRHLALKDDITGVYNRRGFTEIAGQQLKAAKRANREMLVIYAGIDDLKLINDKYGYQEGEAAVIKVAEIFTRNLRDSDIIARISEDQFIILAPDVKAINSNKIIDRIQYDLDLHNNFLRQKGYELALSIGTLLWHPDQSANINAILMYVAAKIFEVRKNKRIA